MCSSNSLVVVDVLIMRSAKYCLILCLATMIIYIVWCGNKLQGWYQICLQRYCKFLKLKVVIWDAGVSLSQNWNGRILHIGMLSWNSVEWRRLVRDTYQKMLRMYRMYGKCTIPTQNLGMRKIGRKNTDKSPKVCCMLAIKMVNNYLSVEVCTLPMDEPNESQFHYLNNVNEMCYYFSDIVLFFEVSLEYWVVCILFQFLEFMAAIKVSIHFCVITSIS